MDALIDVYLSLSTDGIYTYGLRIVEMFTILLPLAWRVLHDLLTSKSLQHANTTMLQQKLNKINRTAKLEYQYGTSRTQDIHNNHSSDALEMIHTGWRAPHIDCPWNWSGSGNCWLPFMSCSSCSCSWCKFRCSKVWLSSQPFCFSTGNCFGGTCFPGKGKLIVPTETLLLLVWWGLEWDGWLSIELFIGNGNLYPSNQL